jgi:F-type H+-transporting ATPase subunit a
MSGPIEQFEITSLSAPLFHIGSSAVTFTNSALLMMIVLALIIGYMILATRSRSLVPGRLQSTAELFYEFVVDTVHESAGKDGMRFFPFVFTVFIFVLVCNVIGIIPAASR